MWKSLSQVLTMSQGWTVCPVSRTRGGGPKGKGNKMAEMDALQLVGPVNFESANLSKPHAVAFPNACTIFSEEATFNIVSRTF